MKKFLASEENKFYRIGYCAGVNFTKVLRAAFAQVDHKSLKIQLSH